MAEVMVRPQKLAMPRPAAWRAQAWAPAGIAHPQATSKRPWHTSAGPSCLPSIVYQNVPARWRPPTCRWGCPASLRWSSHRAPALHAPALRNSSSSSSMECQTPVWAAVGLSKATVTGGQVGCREPAARFSCIAVIESPGEAASHDAAPAACGNTAGGCTAMLLQCAPVVSTPACSSSHSASSCRTYLPGAP